MQYEGFGAYSISISCFVLFGNSFENMGHEDGGWRAFLPFSSSAGERKIMNYIVVKCLFRF
jgi:hypothetical protein